ncbi:MAG: alpha/beta hydrolase [Rhodospirillales bacterium]|nr:alpha/beta hydrolase [Rhodospirillales bacterium]
MDGDIIFGDYTQEGLDAQYDNGAAVPSVDDIMDRWTGLSAETLTKFDHALDIAYGPSAMEKLDIVRPNSQSPVPVNIFIHGGFWMRRDKKEYSFIAERFASSGALTVVINYALIPSVDLDEIVRQCRAAVTWVHGNIAEHGGDPDWVFVTGNSAGGHLVSMMMATDWAAHGGLPSNVLKGGVALSGIYELEPIQKCFINDILHLSDGEVERNSSITLPPTKEAPVLFAVGGAETAEFKRHTSNITEAWSEMGCDCRSMEVPGKNHFSILDDFIDPDSALCSATLKMMGL